jgi:ATP-dependent DNA helicase RecQ
VVKVLAAWDWSQRPTGIVTVPSRARPVLITSLGQRIAQVGRLPYLGSLGYASSDGPGSRRHNSAQRLHSLWHAFTVPDDLREALSRPTGPLLLIDDRIETGWTMTIAAKQLREVGAPAVLPLAFAVTTG